MREPKEPLVIVNFKVTPTEQKMIELGKLLRTMNSKELHATVEVFKRVRHENDTKKIVNEGIVVGTKVTFTARRQKWDGVVTGFTSKKVKVDCGAMKWSVPVSFLTVAQ